MAFQSFASERFWKLYGELPREVQRLADKQYQLFREDPFHPSLREGDVFNWGWIGSHEEYNKLLRRVK